MYISSINQAFYDQLGCSNFWRFTHFCCSKNCIEQNTDGENICEFGEVNFIW